MGYSDENRFYKIQNDERYNRYPRVTRIHNDQALHDNMFGVMVSPEREKGNSNFGPPPAKTIVGPATLGIGDKEKKML